MAHELHDELQASLAAINASAARIPHEEAYLIQENVAAMQELLTHHKELSELQKPNITKNRIDEMAAEVIEQLKPQAGNITLELRADARHALCDQAQMRRAFTHLLANSIKYSQDYGRTKLSLHNMGQNVLVELTDNAIRQPKNKGQEIARTIIENHGSKFLIDQNERGTTTTFLLRTGC